jgi:hypothetical protein
MYLIYFITVFDRFENRNGEIPELKVLIMMLLVILCYFLWFIVQRGIL